MDGWKGFRKASYIIKALCNPNKWPKMVLQMGFHLICEVLLTFLKDENIPGGEVGRGL